MIIWPKCLEPLNCTSDNKYEDFKKAEELLGKIFTTATNEESFQNMGYGVQEASELSKIAKTRQYSANDGIMPSKYNLFSHSTIPRDNEPWGLAEESIFRKSCVELKQFFYKAIQSVDKHHFLFHSETNLGITSK